ncbi:MAG: hypothetical protein D3916_06650 [Candidatus Electrothrix sp. MAN1_4]|nr:hypothetical protein [Candidatus Electrothrix sp. MAN1_4]
MSGVFEWCADWYDKGYYAASPKDNPQGPENGSGRVTRSTCWDWDCSPRMISLADRIGLTPDARTGGLGFRLALPVQQGR